MKAKLPSPRKVWKGVLYGIVVSLFFFDISQATPLIADAGLDPGGKTTGEASNVPGSLSSVDVTVTGTVVDEAGMPIPGVTVSVSGTVTGTATDLDGRYSLTVPEGSSLVFS